MTAHAVLLASCAILLSAGTASLRAQSMDYDGRTPRHVVKQRGDTLWVTSDSVTTRVERRGDSVVVVIARKDYPPRRLDWLVRGDSAYLRRADGRVQAAPAAAALGFFRMVEGMRRVDAALARLP